MNLPQGFKAASASAGFKAQNRADLGLIISDQPAECAAMFTTNLFKAAPVLVCQEIVNMQKPVRAIIANSGQANACTGEEGLANCRATQKLVADLFDLEVSEILPLSTGVIGAQLKMPLWQAAMPQLKDSLGKVDAEGFTRAFMTTDAFPKFLSSDFKTKQGTIRFTAMAKGAGMICPNMATMLAVVLCDAKVERQTWQAMFKRCVDLSFNRVSVDGDTSTNDTILGLVNAASAIELDAEELVAFEAELLQVLSKLAYMLVKDGEGASKVLHIQVEGAPTEKDAENVARTVGHSQLVKTAMYGCDANWGRIVAAIGRSGITINPENVTLSLCGVVRFEKGQPVNDSAEEKLAMLLKENDIDILINLGSGTAKYNFLASDLGHEYVSLNADYRS